MFRPKGVSPILEQSRLGRYKKEIKHRTRRTQAFRRRIRPGAVTSEYCSRAQGAKELNRQNPMTNQEAFKNLYIMFQSVFLKKNGGPNWVNKGKASLILMPKV